MRRIREDGGGFDGRWRPGTKKSNRYPWVMLLVFVLVVVGTTFVSIHTPLVYNMAYSNQQIYGDHSLFSTPRGTEVEKKVTDPYTPIHPDGKISSGWSRIWQKMLPGAIQSEKFYCERSHIRTDVCRLYGNVQLVGNDSFVLNTVDEKTPTGEEKIKPYTRKWEQLCMNEVRELTLKSKFDGDKNSSRACDVWQSVPTVVFSTGGYTGNVYHEFNDGLIPLYITSQHLRGEVIFVIANYQSWWMIKYHEVMSHLSKYEVIDIANYTKSHCFVDVTVGLFIHEELGIDSSLMLNGESIQDFRALLSRAYFLEEPGWEEEFQTFGSSVPAESGKKGTVPLMVIIVREGNRVILNLDKLIRFATGLGFNVVLLKPDPTTEMKKIFWLLNRCDVLIGVHGAALTHFLFLRPESIFIQIIPLGTDWAARTYYGDPAKKLGLHYFDYKIDVEESSLSHEYNRNDPLLLNPNELRQWSIIKEVYLSKQNVELSLPRFSKILEEAKSWWKGRPFNSQTGRITKGNLYKNQRKRVSTEVSGPSKISRKDELNNLRAENLTPERIHDLTRHTL